jgi:hypothetical protein
VAVKLLQPARPLDEVGLELQAMELNNLLK